LGAARAGHRWPRLAGPAGSPTGDDYSGDRVRRRERRTAARPESPLLRAARARPGTSLLSGGARLSADSARRRRPGCPDHPPARRAAWGSGRRAAGAGARLLAVHDAGVEEDRPLPAAAVPAPGPALRPRALAAWRAARAVLAARAGRTGPPAGPPGVVARDHPALLAGLLRPPPGRPAGRRAQPRGRARGGAGSGCPLHPHPAG